MQMTYAVEITIAETGERQISRYFQTIRAARNWVKWCKKAAYISAARIMAGGAGGMEVA
jgi:hypothetical protein